MFGHGNLIWSPGNLLVNMWMNPKPKRKSQSTTFLMKCSEEGLEIDPQPLKAGFIRSRKNWKSHRIFKWIFPWKRPWKRYTIVSLKTNFSLFHVDTEISQNIWSTLESSQILILVFCQEWLSIKLESVLNSFFWNHCFSDAWLVFFLYTF